MPIRWTGLGAAALMLAVSALPPARGAAVQGAAVQDAAVQGAAGSGDGPTPGRDLGAALAAQAAAAAVAACAERGWPVTATVVDRAGQVKAVLRGDGAGSHTIAASLAKAYTSAGLRDSTGAVLDAVQRAPGVHYLSALQGFLAVGGGVPIRAGDDPGAEPAGAIGVGGAPGGHLDEGCARAGIARIRDKLR